MSGTAKKILGLGVVAIAVACALPSVSACGEKKSGLMLAITTDMKAPKDVNAVSVTVKTNDAIKHNVVGRVTPQGEILLPATLAIVEPEDPNASIKIRVMAFQDRKARVLRDVRTSIPSGGRVALLRIPLNFVNDGSVTGEVAEGVVPAPNPGTGGTSSSGGSSGSTSGGPTVDGGGADGGSGSSSGGNLGPVRPAEDPTEFVPNCDNPEFTWIDGECKDAYIDPNTLPDFDESLVGAQESGRCFDAKQCFATAIAVGQGESSGGGSGSGDDPPPEQRDAGVAPAPVDAGMDGQDIGLRAITLDRASCAVALNGANADRLNLAIVTPETGECIRPGQCFIPLDKGGSSGWKDEGGRIKLPTFVCRLLEKPGLRLYASSDTCAAKQESNPICIDQTVAPVDPGTEGGTNAGATLVLAEDRPTDVVVSGSEIYVAGATRIARVPLFGQSIGQPIPGAPGVAAPWRLSHGAFGAGFAATNGTQTGYAFQGSDGALTPVALGASPANGVAFSGNSFYWAIGANGAGGIYASAPGDPSATKLESPSNVAATAITAVGEAIVFADEIGNLTGCRPEGSTATCSQPTKGAEGRIDALMNAGSFGYALSTTGVLRVTGNDIEGFLTEPVATVSAAGVTIDGKYYPRSFAHNDRCIFVSTSAGVEWVAASGGGGSRGVLATVPAGRHAFGVAIGPATGGADTGRQVVYWTLYAPLDSGGGLYASELPVECGGSGQGGGIGPADSGTPTQDAAAEQCTGPGSDCFDFVQCCSKQCIEGKCQ